MFKQNKQINPERHDRYLTSRISKEIIEGWKEWGTHIFSPGHHPFSKDCVPQLF